MNKFINFLNISLLILQISTCSYGIIRYRLIPIHWDQMGNVDSYTTPYILFIFPIITLIVISILKSIKRHPALYNFPTKIKDTSKAISLCNRMMDVVGGWCNLDFTLLLIVIVVGYGFIIFQIYTYASITLLIIYYILRFHSLK